MSELARPNWNYGDAGDRWPVKFGDVWMCGPHILACGDLELGHARDLIEQYGADFAYLDPPWNKGNARSFRTKANRATPSIPTYAVDWAMFIASLLDALSLVREDCFVEMGQDGQPYLLARIKSHGGTVGKTWPITYYKTHPATLNHCWWGTSTLGTDTGGIAGQDDDQTPFIALDKIGRRGATVFDPFVGRGLTSIAAEQQGMSILGMELNPRRLAVAIDKLATLGYHPERMDSL